MASSRDTILLADAFKALGKAVKRKAYESDSDDYIEQPTNRGKKLKKRARFVSQGQLGPLNGPAIYRESIEHAGYRRTIISRNPPLVDEEGYEIDSGDDQERVEEAQAAADDINPYAGIRLEEILAPLTSAADLANHATLSRSFLSTALTELSVQGCNLMHKENEALWKVRPLLTRLCGDQTWAPCEMMLGPNDEDLFDENHSTHRLGPGRRLHSNNHSAHHTPATSQHPSTSPKTNGEPSRPGISPSPVNGTKEKAPTTTEVEIAQKTEENVDPDVTMEDVNAAEDTVARPTTEGPQESNGEKQQPPVPFIVENGLAKADREKRETTKEKDKEKDTAKEVQNGQPPLPSSERDVADAPGVNKEKEKVGEQEKEKEQEPEKETQLQKEGLEANPITKSARQPVTENGHHPTEAPPEQRQVAVIPLHAANGVNGSRAMSTATDGPGPGLEVGRLDDASTVHPFFLAPPSAHPDRDLGIPEGEAEDVRRLLQLYVQKQEEVCRGTKDLYEGLLRADRLRKTVLAWSKAEAHCGPNRDMSDGEDWYDKEEWGLADDLKKGQDEEEEDTSRDQPKKTRNRR